MSWALLTIGIVGLAWMVLVMMRSTGDNAYEVTAQVTVYRAPNEQAEVVRTLAPGELLRCHSVVEAQPEWLDCSDMLERKYVRLARVRPVSD
jgi:hypothetical protein